MITNNFVTNDAWKPRILFTGKQMQPGCVAIKA